MDQSESVDDVMVRSVGWVVSVYDHLRTHQTLYTEYGMCTLTRGTSSSVLMSLVSLHRSQ